MKQLFLSSSVNFVAGSIATRMDTHGKKLVFIDTAAEVEAGDKSWLANDRQSLVDIGFEVVDYTISGKTQADLKKTLRHMMSYICLAAIHSICYSKLNKLDL